jgi:hypothetical protein
MTPQEMADLLKYNATPEKPRTKQITRRLYNVIVRTPDNKVVETYELVSLKMAREIKNESHDENLLVDIIEDYTIDCNGNEINPKPIVSRIENIPSRNRAEQPTYSDRKAQERSARNIQRAQDNISRSRKNKKCEYHMYRIINKAKHIDIEASEAKIAEFFVGRNDFEEFKIIYCGIAESWGKEN